MGEEHKPDLGENIAHNWEKLCKAQGKRHEGQAKDEICENDLEKGGVKPKDILKGMRMDLICDADEIPRGKQMGRAIIDDAPGVGDVSFRIDSRHN